MSAPLQHGYYARSPSALEIRGRKGSAVMRRLRVVAPWLEPSDESTARAYCELEILIRCDLRRNDYNYENERRQRRDARRDEGNERDGNDLEVRRVGRCAPADEADAARLMRASWG